MGLNPRLRNSPRLLLGMALIGVGVALPFLGLGLGSGPAQAAIGAPVVAFQPPTTTPTVTPTVATATPTVTATATPTVATATPTVTATATPTVATATPTVTATATPTVATATPTVTPTATVTVTPGGPTLTPTPTITPGGPTLTPTPTAGGTTSGGGGSAGPGSGDSLSCGVSTSQAGTTITITVPASLAALFDPAANVVVQINPIVFDAPLPPTNQIQFTVPDGISGSHAVTVTTRLRSGATYTAMCPSIVVSGSGQPGSPPVVIGPPAAVPVGPSSDLAFTGRTGTAILVGLILIGLGAAVVGVERERE